MTGLFSAEGLLFIIGIAVADIALGVVIGKFLRGVQSHYPERKP